MDVFLTGLTDRVKLIPVTGDSLLSQIKSVTDLSFCDALVNSYGQMYITVDQQILSSTDRSALTVVMDITKADYGDSISIERHTTDGTSMVELSALTAYDGGADIPIWARAPGNITNAHGSITSYENNVVTDVTECKRIAGALFANVNNDYEPVDITLPANNRLFDIAPKMYATITTLAADNPRGVALTAARLIPRSIAYDIADGAIKTNITFEVEAVGVNGIQYFPPTVDEPNLDSGIPAFKGIDFPSLDSLFPPVVPPIITMPCARNVGNFFSLNFAPNTLTGSTTTLISKAYFPCMVRATGGLAGDTKIVVNYHLEGDASAHLAAYGVFNGSRVLTGVWSGNTITFSPISDTQVDRFEIELDAGAGASITRYVAGKLLETNTVGSINTTLVTNGNYFSLEAYVGYWTATFPAEVVGLHFYNTTLGIGINSGYQDGDGRDGFGVFHLVGQNALYVERASYAETFNAATGTFDLLGNYARVYFQGGAGQTGLQLSSTLTLGATSVGMRWALREAQAIGRQITIGQATLYNVCAIP